MSDMSIEERLYLVQKMRETAASSVPSVQPSFEQESYEMLGSGFSWFFLRLILCACCIGFFYYCDATDTSLFGISAERLAESLQEDLLPGEVEQTIGGQVQMLMKQFY